MRQKTNQNGMALILVMGVLAVLVIFATTFAFNMRLEQRAARNYLDAITTDCIAKAGVEYVIAILKNDDNAYDCYDDSWSTSFRDKDNPSNNQVDNDGNTVNDSIWIDLCGPEGNLLGAYAIYVVDECGKMDINYSGNIVSATSEHASNDGVSTFEINLASLDTAISDSVAADIVGYKYGSDGAPGASGDDDGYTTGMITDLIDNDGDGNVDDAGDGTDEPQEFTVWYERGTNDGPFKTPEEIKLVSSTVEGAWDDIKDKITVYSSTKNRYKRATWSNKLNINAVDEVDDIYLILENGGVTSPTAEQLACNIIDYRDKNNKISDITKGGNKYYGVEPTLMNEVLAASYDLDTTNVSIAADGGSNSRTYPLAVNTCYRMTIYRQGSDYDLDVTVGGSAFGTIPNGTQKGEVGVAPLGGSDLSNCRTGDNGNGTGSITIQISDPNNGDGFIPDGIDVVEFVSCEIIELINIGEEDIDISNWRVRMDMTNFATATCQYYDNGAGAQTSGPAEILAGDYLVIASDEELFARTFGDSSDANWGDDASETTRVVFMDGAGGNGTWDQGYADGDELTSDEHQIDGSGETIELHDFTILPSGLTDIVNNETAEDYGNSGTAGKSREKDDPTLRTAGNWSTHADNASSGSDNTPVAGPPTEDLGDLYIKSSDFANIGEILNGTITPSGGPYEGIRRPYVAAGDEWNVINQSDFEKIADKITTSCIKLEAEAATHGPAPLNDWNETSGAEPYNTKSYYTDTDGDESKFTWSNARIKPGNYKLYIYGYDINGDAINVSFDGGANWEKVVAPYFEYEDTDGVYIKTISSSDIDSDGSFDITLRRETGAAVRVYFDYLVLVPQVIHGRININTASSEVLEGLPGIAASGKAGNIITGRPYGDEIDAGSPSGILGIGQLLKDGVLTPSEFAKISNLITTNSDAFRVYCTARAVKDMDGDNSYTDGTDVTLAEKRIEAIVDRSSSPIRILSWQEITE